MRVLIVDDHPVVRQGLAALLATEAGIDVVGAAADGTSAITLAGELRPDAVLCDLRLGDGPDGVAVTAAVRGLAQPPAVLILTTYDNDSDIVRAVLAGAAGYLLKDAEPADIVAGLRDAVAGHLVLTPDLERRVTERMVHGVPTLSDRELDVLRLVALGRSNREVAAELYVTEATVKNHLVHAFAKLGADSRTAAVAIARQHGLID